jgi:hypothetical protein
MLSAVEFLMVSIENLYTYISAVDFLFLALKNNVASLETSSMKRGGEQEDDEGINPNVVDFSFAKRCELPR